MTLTEQPFLQIALTDLESRVENLRGELGQHIHLSTQREAKEFKSGPCGVQPVLQYYEMKLMVTIKSPVTDGLHHKTTISDST